MAALSANNPNAITCAIAYQEFPVKGSTHIYQGARVCVNGSGLLVPAADTSGLRYVGIAMAEVNNTGSDGSVSAQVQTDDVLHTIAIASTATQATVGVHAFLVDDQTVDIAANSTNKVCLGLVTKFLSAGWVQVDTRYRYTIANAA